LEDKSGSADEVSLALDASMSAEELQALLTASSQHQPGVLVDVHQRVVDTEECLEEQGAAGTGFCVVGADDSEDGGFGVVGLAGTGVEKDIEKKAVGGTGEGTMGRDEVDDQHATAGE
jgi:hypothetical protein